MVERLDYHFNDEYEREMVVNCLNKYHSWNPNIFNNLKNEPVKYERQRMIKEIEIDLKKDVVPKGVIKISIKYLKYRYNT